MANDISDAVNARVKQGWHFKTTGTEVYAFHDLEPRYHRCAKVSDVLAAIETENAAIEAAKQAEANAAVSVVREGPEMDWSDINQ